jgi:DNA (cytosine-5)-methyltransferase 1
MKFLDLFAGIGGFRLGLEQAGHECVGFCEIDKFARQSYKAIHNTEGEREYHDITTVSNEEWRTLRGTVELICGGFPCQAFSIAGKRKGFLDETRGTLFFEIARAAEQIKPRTLFLENVRGLLSHDKGRTFGIILNTLDELGYDCEWQVFNSAVYVPQNRERVFIVGHLREGRGPEIFPITRKGGEIGLKVIGVIEDKGYTNSTGRVYDPAGIAPTLLTMQGGGLEPKIAIPVLTPDRAEKRQNGRRFKENGEPMFTLTAQDRHGVMLVGNINPSGNGMNGNVYSSDGLSPTLTTNKGEGPKIAIKVKEATKQGFAVAELGDSINFSLPNSKTRRGRVGKQQAQTLDTQCNQAVIIQQPRGFNSGGEHEVSPTLSSNSWQENNFVKIIDSNYGIVIRKLTPRECWRLQGFPDWAFDKAQEVNSNSQLYKQAGNSVTVPVIYEIARRFE